MIAINFFTPPPDPLSGVKGQIFKFHNNSVVNIFTEISHADRGTTDKKHINRDFSLNILV